MSTNPATIYSVSAKAIIRNELGHVLLVKEHSDNWSLPGGGVEHDETPISALERELYEEIGAKSVKINNMTSAFTYYAPVKGVWRMWLLYDVVLSLKDIKIGEETRDVAFVDISSFVVSKVHAEQRIYTAIMGAQL